MISLKKSILREFVNTWFKRQNKVYFKLIPVRNLISMYKRNSLFWKIDYKNYKLKNLALSANDK